MNKLVLFILSLSSIFFLGCSNTTEVENYYPWQNDEITEAKKRKVVASFTFDEYVEEFYLDFSSYKEIINESLLTESKYNSFCEEILKLSVDEVINSDFIYRAKSKNGLLYEIYPLKTGNASFIILRFDINDDSFKNCFAISTWTEVK